MCQKSMRYFAKGAAPTTKFKPPKLATLAGIQTHLKSFFWQKRAGEKIEKPSTSK